MRILILNSDYPRFLAWLYLSQPGLANASYASQIAARNASLFGVADFYSKNFATLGHTATEIHVNNRWLQSAWAREHGMSVETPGAPGTAAYRSPPAWLQRVVKPFKPMLRPLARRIRLSPSLDAQDRKILLAQIEEFRPDIVLNQDVFQVDAGLARQIKGIGRPVLIGQIGIEPTRGADWTAYSLMISQLPAVVGSFRSLGVPAEVNHLAFEATILDRLPKVTTRDIDISFVGTVSIDHQQRVALLEAVAARYDLKLWGNRPQALPTSSLLHRCFQGEVWGADMYQVLQRSHITLNSHIDLVGREAGNMRLFEATGVGAFLLTDYKDNLNTLFRPGTEVVAWHSIDDCLKTIDRCIADDAGRAAIARAGQARTLAQHTYHHRVREICGFVEKIRTPA